MSTPARRVAYEVLLDVQRHRAFANIALRDALDGLDDRDRRWATEVVYGTVRMQRALDASLGRFLTRSPKLVVQVALRMGAYQLMYMSVPAHAAVSQTVELVHPGARPFVNAVLRSVAKQPMSWSNRAVELSYPDWIVDLFTGELGDSVGWACLEAMNHAPQVDVRADGYRQNRSSQRIVELVGASSGELVIDVCAAPGGKATGLATAASHVIAGDITWERVRLIDSNRHRIGVPNLSVVQWDARQIPLREQVSDRVLVDAPCSGLGVLHRRADARWRVQAEDIERLAVLQTHLLKEAARIVKPGGELWYSVCTLAREETVGVTEHVTPQLIGFHPIDIPDGLDLHGCGRYLLPDSEGADGMYFHAWRRGAGD